MHPLTIATALAVLLAQPIHAQGLTDGALIDAGLAVGQWTDDPEWVEYTHPQSGFSVELPLGLFEITAETPERLTLTGAAGARLEIYAAANSQRRSPRDFVAAIEDTVRFGEITYRAGGNSWFVLSGYAPGEAGGDLVVYTKFMFSPDLTRVAAFEISYPVADRRFFDDAVERIEDSFHRPR